MSSSVLYMSMSLDGYIAGPNDEPANPGGDGFDRLHEWFHFGPDGQVGQLSGDARQLVDQMDARVRGELGESVFGIDSETLSSVALKLMTERKLFLGTMESCTGGLLASLLTDTPGVSTMFRGGLVSYATDLKEEWGVPREVVERHGVISVETARAMAQAARERLHADIGVGVTGVAGPDKQEDKPVGTVHIAVASAAWTRDTSQRFNGGRAEIKWRAAQTALNLLRLSLLRE